MNVKQQIMVGTLRVGTISNSSILQIGATGFIQAYAKDTDEYYVVPESHDASGTQETSQKGDASISTGGGRDEAEGFHYQMESD